MDLCGHCEGCDGPCRAQGRDWEVCSRYGRGANLFLPPPMMCMTPPNVPSINAHSHTVDV